MTVKVALVVVHGVADHAPLETSRAVVDLLVSSAPSGTSYVARAAEAIRLPVDPLAPRNAPRVDHTATPQAKDRSTAKAFAQSHRSDFQREDWSAPEDITLRQSRAAGPATGAAAGAVSPRDAARSRLSRSRSTAASRSAISCSAST